ncbi:MAG: hypothetical protein JOZ39_04550, partial [Chloroflexi bacterium]|nr:hypothetical protein [Chloroflexota bacterium]
ASFSADVIHVSGQAADDMRAELTRRDDSFAGLPPVIETAHKIMRGEMRIDDLDPSSVYRLNVEDTVAQIGQGTIADRVNERLGRSDAGVILLRKLWSQELHALAEGQPLRQWRQPERLAVTSGA